jgi:hypothetical protein
MPPDGKVLYSWKEIADCLGVTVRSVQRWEKESGLPVYRQGPGARARVFAYEAELLAWRNRGADSATAQQASGAAPLRPAPEVQKPWLRLPARWIAAAVVLGAAAILAADPGLIPALREPAAWSFEKQRLKVVDAKGRLCWEKHFPGAEGSTVGVVDLALIADLDGAGGAEVLFNYAPSTRGSESGVLYCYSRRGDVKWSFRFGTPKRFGDRDFDQSYSARFVGLVSFAGRQRVLTVANHQVWYPAQVALLDPATGSLEEQYWHPGAIHRYLVHDLDQDGHPELLLGAINNPGVGLGHPGLAVLRLPFGRRTAGEWRAIDRFPPLTGGGEAAYAVFPTPDLNRVAGVFPFFANLTIDGRNRVFIQLALPDSCAVSYYLNSRLEVEEFRPTDDYAALHNRYRVQGLLDHNLSQGELAMLEQVFVLTNAPDGNSTALDKLWRPEPGDH